MTDDARLKSRADSPKNSLAAEHIDLDTLRRHAAAAVSPLIARVVNEHLQVCEDGRCVELVRSFGGEVEALSGAREALSERGGVRGRTFQARDGMWAQFETMAREANVSTDELVCEAMSAYARVRGYDVGDDDLKETHEAPALTPLDRSYTPSSAHEDDLARTVGPGPSVRPGNRTSDVGAGPRSAPISPPSPPHKRPAVAPVAGRRLPPPQPPSNRASQRSSAPAISRPPSLPPRVTPPSGVQADSSNSGSSPSSRAKRLVLNYRGQAHPVEKERFLLGRSKTQADLRLDDANVSRQHAVIERVGAAWYIVDLGSTNGIHVAGERVVRRALSDGDVVVITTHEIHCTLR